MPYPLSHLRWLAVLFLLAAGAAQAAVFRGVVTHVTDGDTIWVRPAGSKETVEIRLLDLDAPEGCQPFGTQAKRALAARILKETVQVRTQGEDDYRRVLARVRHKGQDVGGWLVREGHAWSTDFRGRVGPYEKYEQQARQGRLGLWAARDPMEPRNFRRNHGRCQ
jgi:endonuclease YncB( thermonuclease family)